MKCNENHNLCYYETKEGQRNCDICHGGYILAYTFKCFLCNFDICLKCYRNIKSNYILN